MNGGRDAEGEAERATRVLRERAAVLARRRGADPDEGAALDVLAFDAGAERYAITVGSVLRVERVERVARVPGAPPHVVGLVYLLGRTCALVDVPVLLGAAGPAAMRRWAIVLGRRRPEVALGADVVTTERLRRDEVLGGGGEGPRLGVTPDARVVLDGVTLVAAVEATGRRAP